MKNCLQKYDEHKIIFEIICTILMVCFVGLICFNGFLQPTWKNFSQTHAHYFLRQKQFVQKKSMAQAEKNIAMELHSWQQKHPNFYHAIKNINTTHDRSEILTKIIQQSQFIITHVSSHHINHEISVQATAGFSNLLTLLSALNKNPLSFTLTQLSIDHVNQFNMQFASRKTYVKK